MSVVSVTSSYVLSQVLFRLALLHGSLRSVFSLGLVLSSGAPPTASGSLGLLSKGLLTITHLGTADPAWVPQRSSHTAAWASMSETVQ